MNPMEVWISSGMHVDSIVEREKRIDEKFDNPDVVFAEGAEKSTGRNQFISILKIIPNAPLLAAAVVVQIYLVVEAYGMIMSIVTDGKRGRDVDIVRNLTSRHDIERREIDNEPLSQYVHNYPITWGIANWGSLLVITALWWPSPITAWKVILYGAILLLAGYLMLVILLAVANHAREETMARVISDESRKHDQAVVVLGEAHHQGVGRRLLEDSDINVLNPEPENLDWRTGLVLQSFNAYRRLFGR